MRYASEGVRMTFDIIKVIASAARCMRDDDDDGTMLCAL